MKIAIVTETFLPSTDGIVTRLTKAIDYMLEEGHEVIVMAPDVGNMPHSYRTARIYPMPSKNFFFYKHRPWGVPSTKVGKLLQFFEPDIVHVVSPFSLGVAGVHYAKKYDIPLICSFHTNIPHYLGHYGFEAFETIVWKYIVKLHNEAKVNLVTSEAMYDLLDEQGVHGLEILPKGVDVENRHPSFYSESMRERLTEGEVDKKLLIFVGRLAPEKNIASLKEILSRREDLRLAIIGDGPSKEDLEETFAGTPTAFTGFLHGEELSKAYASGDAFIFPSKSETLGLVITEAMASGTPVIAAYSEPTAEQITHLDNGFMFDGEDLPSLDEAVDFIDQKGLMAEVSENARDYAEQFSWENASAAMVEAYEKTLVLNGVYEYYY